MLDLGCGDGSLLSLLTEELDVQGYGIEINDAGVLASTDAAGRLCGITP